MGVHHTRICLVDRVADTSRPSGGRLLCSVDLAAVICLEPFSMSYARHTLATRIDTDYADVAGTGSFKIVYHGTFRDGSRANQPCVKKCIKPGCGEALELFKSEKAIVSKAAEPIEKFNDAGLSTAKTVVYMNVPEIFRDRTGRETLVEPFIRNFEKFNSNSGWTNPSQSIRCLVLQALSHFSYHASGGQFLLCDLQGGTFCKGIALTDPVICSRTRRFGPTDLGVAGIQTFFAKHVCNHFCKKNWQKPRMKASLHVSQGTRIMSKSGAMVPLPKKIVQPLHGIAGVYSRSCLPPFCPDIA